MTATADLYRTLTRFPGGKTAFSILFSQKAPYFASVRPQVREARPNHAEVLVRKRRGVTNHLGTVHVIAICNGLEAAMGLLAESTVPDTMRWIPKGMEVSYPAKATSDILCVARTVPADWAHPGEVAVQVKALRADGTTVVEGVIRLHLSARPTTG